MSYDLYGSLEHRGLNAGFGWNPDYLNDKEYSGIVTKETILDSANLYDLLYYDFINKGWRQSSCEFEFTLPARAILVNENTLLHRGLIRNDLWNNSGEIYVKSNTGQFTTSYPNLSNTYIQNIGFFIKPNILYLHFNSVWMLNI